MLNLKGTRIDSRVIGLLDRVRAWAEGRLDISAIALVGSHAHGRARPDSDIDLIILSDAPDPLRQKKWLDVFGDSPEITTEQWGILTAHRIVSSRNGEIEVGVAPSSWADIPVDQGTYRVVSDGIIAVYDPLGALSRLIDEVRGGGKK